MFAVEVKVGGPREAFDTVLPALQAMGLGNGELDCLAVAELYVVDVGVLIRPSTRQREDVRELSLDPGKQLGWMGALTGCGETCELFR